MIITSKCPKCHIENIVKTPYGVWKCPGCGFTSESIPVSGSIIPAKPVSKRQKTKVIFTKNPVEHIHKKKINQKDVKDDVREILPSYLRKIKPVPVETLKSDNTLKNYLFTSVNIAAGPDGWANLGTVSTVLRKQFPSFDQRRYGCKKFYELIKKIELFEIKENIIEESSCKLIFIKIKS